MAIERVRRLIARGPREVIWSPPSGLGFGNMLYAYLHASSEVSKGRDCHVLMTPVMADWFTRYPRLKDRLTIERGGVHWHDRRNWAWRDRFGINFSRSDLHEFIKFYLEVARVPEHVDPGVIAVNVRRGDYYDVPHFRGTYSFDVAGYLEVALDRCSSTAPITQIVFVSDGLDWCRLKLDRLAREFASDVSYFEGDATASFQRVAQSSRIIGTNSSFSYWAGYVSGDIHQGNGHIVMPRFHARLGDDWSAYQLDPNWDVVNTIPGGWNS